MSLFGVRRWPVTLRHGPITLRPLRLRDEDEWHSVRARNHAWTQPWDSTRPPEAEGPGITFAQMVATNRAEGRAGRALPWGIFWAEPGEPPRLAGQMTISGIAYGSARWAMAGYWVDSALAGRGIAPTALALATDHCFGFLGLHRMEVAIRPENSKSLRVVEKLGFRLEGLRPAFMHVDGAWRDHLVYVLHAEEVGAGGVLARLKGGAPGEVTDRS
ncbi:GNAT family protein [Propioniciclava sp.]|uniref:GNAT family N-acetyltransferase n=1 Tax=Propioniciclava sp. TaxID=2038686 RepID=UPI002633CA53|nr:GNAT family protein [Propioniciclava sp.]